jgi:hypothetical protein
VLDVLAIWIRGEPRGIFLVADVRSTALVAIFAAYVMEAAIAVAVSAALSKTRTKWLRIYVPFFVPPAAAWALFMT